MTANRLYKLTEFVTGRQTNVPKRKKIAFLAFSNNTLFGPPLKVHRGMTSLETIDSIRCMQSRSIDLNGIPEQILPWEKLACLEIPQSFVREKKVL